MQTKPHQTLILASSSPYRKEVLQKLRIPFECISPEVDETPLKQETAVDTALRLAQAKAKKVADLHPNALIIGCDQVATLNGIAIGKPITHEKAVAQLTMLSGQEVTFNSALCLYDASKQHMQVTNVPYLVKFKQLNTAQIERYLHLDQPYQCAGSAKSESLGIALMEYMRGDDPNALIGLPLIALVQMFENIGVHCP